MDYLQRNHDNSLADPALGFTTVNRFSGNEGWATKQYKDFNADFQARNHDNTTRTPAAYQRHNESNNAVSA